MPTDQEMPHLHRCIELATEALNAGDHPFGPVLVNAGNEVLTEDRNGRVRPASVCGPGAAPYELRTGPYCPPCKFAQTGFADPFVF